jgi:hypothetical protein
MVYGVHGLMASYAGPACFSSLKKLEALPVWQLHAGHGNGHGAWSLSTLLCFKLHEPAYVDVLAVTAEAHISLSSVWPLFNVWLYVQTPRALGRNLRDGVWQRRCLATTIMQQLQFLPLSGSTTKIVHSIDARARMHPLVIVWQQQLYSTRTVQWSNTCQ